jgi:hypothetical protein
MSNFDRLDTRLRFEWAAKEIEKVFYVLGVAGGLKAIGE